MPRLNATSLKSSNFLLLKRDRGKSKNLFIFEHICAHSDEALHRESMTGNEGFGVVNAVAVVTVIKRDYAFPVQIWTPQKCSVQM